MRSGRSSARSQSERLRDVYLIGDIEKDTARSCIERLRELANDSNTADHALHQQRRRQRHRRPRHSRRRSATSSAAASRSPIIVQGMAYSMGSIVLQAASEGRRLAFPHSWIMIHEPAKWAGWQSTSAAAQHLERLKQMQDQIYKILSSRSGKPLRQIIRDTKRTDFYLDAHERARIRADRRRAWRASCPSRSRSRSGPETRPAMETHAAVAAGRGSEGDAGA